MPFWSLTHVANKQLLVGAVNVGLQGYTVYGAVYALDANTGEIVRRDSICPAREFYSIRSAWLNDSGTVMCYTCWGGRPRLVEYPSMQVIEDPVLTSKKWSDGRVSSTGRYMILYEEEYLAGFDWITLYDRVSGELFDLFGATSTYDNDRGEDPFFAPQFSGDDRLLVTGFEHGVHVWDVEARRRIGSVYNARKYYHYMLSHKGDKLLVSTRGGPPIDSWAEAAVYDAWTMTPEWSRPIKNYFGAAVDPRGAVSFDGTEVMFEQRIQTDTGLRRGYYWYALPDTTPRGFIQTGLIQPWFKDHWLQPKTAGTGFISGKLGPAQYTWNAALSVTTTPEEPRQPLYPNPTTGEVVVSVGQCQNESWQLRLSDQAGTLIREGTAYCIDGNVRTTLQSLPAGQYYLQLREQTSGRSVQAVVVLHR